MMYYMRTVILSERRGNFFNAINTMNTNMRRFYLSTICLVIILVFNVCFASGEEGADLKQVRGVVHLNSDVSSGDFSPEELTAMAKDAGIGTVFLTENLSPQWEYGLYPFRGIIKKSVKLKGLLTYGPEKYYNRIRAIDETVSGVSVHMSAEVAPFYYWTGDPFKKGLTLNEWDVQFIVTGMKAEDYSGIPTVSNGGFSEFGAKSILMLWPFILVIAGIVSLKKKHPRFYLADPLCWLFIVAGGLFAMHYFPFKEALYNQYNGDQKTGPYQAAIDYINERGGMTFWSSPEASVRERRGPVMYAAPSAAGRMLTTKNYTGFCCFYEGYRQVGSPGGVWDTVLGEYCRGERSGPVWAIGEMSYHGKRKKDNKKINEVQTVFLVPSNTQQNVLNAMRQGKMYALRRTEKLTLQLDSFVVKYPGGVASGIMGEEINAAGAVTIGVELSWKGMLSEPVRIRLVRSGKVIKEEIVKTPGYYEYNDNYYVPGEKIYYRLDIREKYPNMLFSNPIFVRFRSKK